MRNKNYSLNDTLEVIWDILWLLIVVSVIVTILYSFIGTSGKVDRIKSLVPHQVKERNWRILRYEGYSYGAWGNHGGKVWYHMQDLKRPEIQYRVYVTLWNGELQWNYGEPEELQRVNVDIQK